jgi:hypothetical protein
LGERDHHFALMHRQDFVDGIADRGGEVASFAELLGGRALRRLIGHPVQGDITVAPHVAADHDGGVQNAELVGLRGEAAAALETGQFSQHGNHRFIGSLVDQFLDPDLLDRCGTLEPGKDADVLVVEGDPLADLGMLAQVRHVLRAGEVVNTAPVRTGTPSEALSVES